MSLSPGDESDESCVETIIPSPVHSGHWSIRLKTGKRQTRCDHNQAKVFARAFGCRLCVTNKKTIRVQVRARTLDFGRLLVVQRHGVFLITRRSRKWEIQSCAVYRSGLLSVSHAPDVDESHAFIGPGKSVCIDYAAPRQYTLTVSFRRVDEHHHPFVSSLLETAVNSLEPGFSMWYATDTETRHAVVLQDNSTGHFFCISSGCTKSFKTFQAWREHYHTQTPPASRFSRAMFCNGCVVPFPGDLQDRLVPYPSIKDTLAAHGWSYKSLGDQKHGQLMHHRVCQLLGM